MKSPQKVAVARLRQHTKFSVFYVTLCPFFTSLCKDVDDIASAAPTGVPPYVELICITVYISFHSYSFL